MAVKIVTKSRSRNGKSWCVSFEHPFRQQPGTKKGQPVRAALHTNGEEEAEKLRKQLQDLVGDEAFWTLKAKVKAKTVFDERVVAAVYDEQQHPVFEDVRDNGLPFRSEEGYADVHLIGEQGSGKTRLLRQLLGLKEEAEPFPALGSVESSAYAMEWLSADQEYYEAIVTFVPFLEMKECVEEAVCEAATAYIAESSEFGMVEALIGKGGRMRSLMGQLPAAISRMYGWLPSFTDDQDRKRWAPYIKAIQAEALKLRNEMIARGEDTSDSILFQRAWKAEARCGQISRALVEEIERNFSLLEEGSMTYHEDDWPLSWRFQTSDRSYFFQLLYQLFGDDAVFDGKQLSGLVEGMRLKGPFRPLSHEGPAPKWMVTEQHTEAGKWSARQMKNVRKADMVVFVEKGLTSQPSPLLEHLIVSGRADALTIVLTGMDDMTGNRFRTYDEKGEQLCRLLHERIQAAGERWGERAERALTRVCRQNGLHMVSHTADLSAIDVRQKLTHVLETSTIPKEVSRVHPIYLSINTALAVYEGTKRFHHTLKHEADMVPLFTSCLGEALYRFFLRDPAGWSIPDASHLEKDRAIERVSAYLHEALLTYAEEELYPALAEKEGQRNGRELLQHLIPTEKEALLHKPFLRDMYALLKAAIERAEGIVIS